MNLDKEIEEVLVFIDYRLVQLGLNLNLKEGFKHPIHFKTKDEFKNHYISTSSSYSESYLEYWKRIHYNK